LKRFYRCDFLAAIAAGAATLLIPDTAEARCTFDKKAHINRCYAGIRAPMDLVQSSGSIADRWAACLQMVLGYWGVDMPKEQIASRQFERAVGWAVKDTRRQERLEERLSDGLLPQVPGVDVRVQSYERIEFIMFYDLTHDRPLIIGNQEDVMVLTDIYYTKAHHSPKVQSAMVLDPRPGGGRRDLCAVRLAKSRRDWRWGKHDYHWQNIAFAVRVEVDPDRRHYSANTSSTKPRGDVIPGR